jgi:hypothetical protein
MSLHDCFVTAARKVSYAGWSAKQALKKAVKAAPARLLQELATSMLNTVENLTPASTSYRGLMGHAINLIALLSSSDRPGLAVDVVLRFLWQLPDASSYFRALKWISLGRRLQPDQAKDMVARLSTFIHEGLEQNKRPSNWDMTDIAEAANQLKHFVKITTVKLFAEILAQANFIPTTMAVSLLEDLFRACHHIDVRA